MSRLKRYATTALSIICLTALLIIGIIDHIPDSVIPDASETLTASVMTIAAIMAGGTVASDARVRHAAEKVDVHATALQIIDRVNELHDDPTSGEQSPPKNSTPTHQQPTTQE